MGVSLAGIVLGLCAYASVHAMPLTSRQTKSHDVLDGLEFTSGVDLPQASYRPPRQSPVGITKFVTECKYPIGHPLYRLCTPQHEVEAMKRVYDHVEKYAHGSTNGMLTPFAAPEWYDALPPSRAQSPRAENKDDDAPVDMEIDYDAAASPVVAAEKPLINHDAPSPMPSSTSSDVSYSVVRKVLNQDKVDVKSLQNNYDGSDSIDMEPVYAVDANQHGHGKFDASEPLPTSFLINKYLHDQALLSSPQSSRSSTHGSTLSSSPIVSTSNPPFLSRYIVPAFKPAKPSLFDLLPRINTVKPSSRSNAKPSSDALPRGSKGKPSPRDMLLKIHTTDPSLQSLMPRINTVTPSSQYHLPPIDPPRRPSALDDYIWDTKGVKRDRFGRHFETSHHDRVISHSFDDHEYRLTRSRGF
jgi:hypothetical protein